MAGPSPDAGGAGLAPGARIVEQAQQAVPVRATACASAYDDAACPGPTGGRVLRPLRHPACSGATPAIEVVTQGAERHCYEPGDGCRRDPVGTRGPRRGLGESSPGRHG